MSQSSEKIESKLFKNRETKNDDFVVLIDASYSTNSKVKEMDYKTVHEIQGDVVMKLIDDPNKLIRVIHWNSDNDHPNITTGPKFENGIEHMPFPIKSKDLSQQCAWVRKTIEQNTNCLTMPHLAFKEVIESKIIDNNKFTNVILVTDGQMGWAEISYIERQNLRTDLATYIKELFKHHPNIALTILTVEPINRDFNNLESMNNAAGTDVFDVIREKGLTNLVYKMVSYTPNHKDGFVHFTNIKPPKGMIGFGDKYFSPVDIPMFIEYIKLLIKSTDEESEHEKIMEKLSSTLSKIIEDKPKNIQDNIIKSFANLFSNTQMNLQMVKYILEKSVENKTKGMGKLHAEFRAEIKNFFKMVNKMMTESTRKAIGMEDKAFTYPIQKNDEKESEYVIISCPAKQVVKSLVVGNKNLEYPQACMEQNNILLPCLPFNKNHDNITEQVTRQFLRQVVAKIYSINFMDDLCMYVVLADCLRTVISDVNDDIKNNMRTLATIMLKKKRLNVNQTELEKLKEGNFPIPNNGSVDKFYHYMKYVNEILKIKVEPMTTWFLLCLSLNGIELTANQLNHCKDDLEKDFPNIKQQDLLTHIRSLNLIDLVTHIVNPEELYLEYVDYITLENTYEGGYSITKHQSNMGAGDCSPNYVISKSTKEKLDENPNNRVCPHCYLQLDSDQFTPVQPKPENLEQNVFGPNQKPWYQNNTKPVQYENNNTKTYTIQNEKKDSGIVILMKGPVGSGKSTITNKIKIKLTEQGYDVISVGVDEYCKDGLSFGQANNAINQKLYKHLRKKSDKKVVIIDTCGERHNSSKKYFGVNFDQWNTYEVWPNRDLSNKKLDKQYVAWCLYNVLNRKECTPESNYWLNPYGAGLDTCFNVWKKKAILLGLNPSVELNLSENIEKNLEKCVGADEYLKTLRTPDEEANYHINIIFNKN